MMPIVLIVGVRGAGDAVPGATLTHLMGVLTAPTAAVYRARADDACVMALEYSVNSDLSGSTPTGGVTVASVNDFTGGETLTGLTANTRYYYAVTIDGVRAHSAPYPSFKTQKAAGVDAPGRPRLHRLDGGSDAAHGLPDRVRRRVGLRRAGEADAVPLRLVRSRLRRQQ
jgi:hypothetical protein